MFKEFVGKIIAIIHREDDVEEKYYIKSERAKELIGNSIRMYGMCWLLYAVICVVFDIVLIK